MTYNEFIQNILDTRGRFNIPDNEYHERHHIKPKCFGGNNDEENLIDLYPEEHYDAHRMLAEENPMCIGLLYARFRMAGGGGKTKMRPVMSQEEYSEARKNYAAYLSKNWTGENNPNYGKPGAVGDLNGMRGRDRSGENGYWYGKHRDKNTYEKWCKSGKRPVLQFDKELNFIREYDSAIDAHKETGICYTCIKDAARGRNKSAGGFIWKYKDDKPSVVRIVNQIDNDMNIVASFSSYTEAQRKTGINKCAIRNCCVGAKGFKTAGGYKWEVQIEQKGNIKDAK